MKLSPIRTFRDINYPVIILISQGLIPRRLRRIDTIPQYPARLWRRLFIFIKLIN